jgi:hypothetical protein
MSAPSYGAPHAMQRKGMIPMRRLLAGLTAPLLIALFAAAPAFANHTHVGSSVRILHGTTDVATYLSQDPDTGGALLSCSGTLCETPVPLNNRDYGRFVRWCGTDSQAITIPSGSMTGVVTCTGPGGWSIRVAATLNDCSAVNCVPTTHGEDVEVDVNAIRQ